MTVATEASANPVLSFESSNVLASNEDASPDLTAGSHPFALTASFKLKTTTDSQGRLVSEGGEPADAIVELPAGMAVDPLAVHACGAEEFATFNTSTGEDGCRNASAVGVIEIESVTPSTLAERKTSRTPIYDLTPPADAPALLGFKLAGAAVYLTPSIRSGSDYGLTVAMTGIPQGARVLGSSVTLWGVPSEKVHDGERGTCVESHSTCPAGSSTKSFVTLPTQCSIVPAAKLLADSWQEQGQFDAVASDYLTGSDEPLGSCQGLGFAPTLSTQLESTITDTPTGLEVRLQLPQSEGPGGVGESQLRDAVVTLPAGITLNLARANGLVGCPLEGPQGVDLDTNGASHCPDAAKVGAVKLKTPFLAEELKGAVYLAEQGDLAGAGSNPFGTMLALYVVAEGSGIVVKLPAEVHADRQTGQLTMRIGPDPVTGQAFAPQLPLAELDLQFDGGAHGTFVTPPTCGGYTTTSTLTPWSGGAPVTLGEELHVTEGCTKAFNPSFAAGTADKRANAFSPVTVTLGRADGEQEFKSFSTTLPEGLLAIVGSVELCPEQQAMLGACGQNSLIGHAIVAVGVGPEPVTLTAGKVYFTGPYGGGSFGLSVVVPAVVGPFNLGQQGRPLVIRAGIHVDPLTGRVTISTDPEGPYAIPSILEGIVPQIRTIQIAIDRPQFTFNPSNCSAQAFTGTATSTQGATASLSTAFQSTNCATLPFGPKLTAALVDKPSRKNGVGFDVKIVEGFVWESNAHYVKVELPKQLPSRLSTLQKACPIAVFQANPATCPAGSVIGTARAVTSALPVPLVGPVYLVSHGNTKFPEVVQVLQGYGVTIDLYGETFISPAGITSTTFPEIPEAPIPLYELHLPAGPNSALTASGGLCEKDLRIPTTIVAYNGLAVKESPQITVPWCRPTLKMVGHSFRQHRVTISVRVPSPGRLMARGRGLVRLAKRVSRAGIVKLVMKLTGSERHLLARHGKKSRRLNVKLVFVPTHGARLSARVRIAAR